MARIGPSAIESRSESTRPRSISSPGPPGSFEFETALPGSKSLTLRDCAIAALADGASTIRYPGEADDYWRMKDCLRRLGIAVDDSHEDAVTHRRSRRRSSPPGRVELDVGQSAVTARLMLAFAALRPDVTVIDGHISMQKRPNKDLVDALRALGAHARIHRRRTPAHHRERHARTARTGARARHDLQPVPHQPADHRAADRGRAHHRGGRRAHQQAVRRSHARRNGEVRRAGRQPGLPHAGGARSRPIAPAPSTWKATHRRRRISPRWRPCTARASRSPISARARARATTRFFGLCEKLGARVTRSAGKHRDRRPAHGSTRHSTRRST